jgi:quinol monooxygenase YgiN
MYGLIGKLRCTPGQRDAVIELLLGATQAMPGCRSYVVARDGGDADARWLTEVWDIAEEKKASL